MSESQKDLPEEEKKEEDNYNSENDNKKESSEKKSAKEKSEEEKTAELIKKTQDELDTMKKRIEERDKVYTRCELLEVTLSRNVCIERDGNIIRHKDQNDNWETCLIGKPFSKGIHKITFKRVGKTPVIFGIINSDTGCPSSSINLMGSGHGIGIAVTDTLTTNFMNFVNNTPTGIILTVFNFGLIGETISQVLFKDFDKNAVIKNNKGKEIAGFKRVNDEDEISLEVNLTSSETKERTMTYFVNGEQSPVTFFSLPDNIQFGVSLKDKNSVTSFMILEELQKPTGENFKKSKRIQWIGNSKI